MQSVPDISEIEARAKAWNVEIDDVLRRAGVARTTWWRWSEGRFEPRLATLRKVHQALEAAVEDKRGAA